MLDKYIVKKSYLNSFHFTTSLPILLLIISLVGFNYTFANAEKMPFSFDLLVKKSKKFEKAKKEQGGFFMLFEQQQFGFEIKAKKDGFIGLWYQKGEDSKLIPFPSISSNIYPVIKDSTYQVISNSSNNFYATNIEQTDSYYAIYETTRKQLTVNDEWSDLEIKSKQFLKIEIDISPVIPEIPKPIKDCSSDKYLREIKNNIRNKKIINVKGDVYLLSLSANTAGLRNTHLDACRFKYVMKHLLSIPEKNIKLYQNVLRNDFIAGMNWLKEVVKSENDLVIFYFSGHGSTYPQKGGFKEKDNLDEVLITQDQLFQEEKQLLDEDIMIKDDFIYQELSYLSTPRVLSIVDACHAGGTARMPKDSRIKSYYKGRFGTKFPSTSKYCKSLSGKGVLFAASEESKPTLELKNGGEFTLALLNEIAKTKGKITLDKLFLNVNASGNPCIVGERSIIRNLEFISR